MKKLQKLIKNIFIFFILLIAVLLVFTYGEKLFKYIIHGKSFYYVYLGDVEYKNNNYSGAIEYYSEAVNLYPEHVKARYNLANIYATYEDYPNAIKEYKKVLELEPKFLNAGINLGILQAEELRDFDGAINTYNEVIGTKTPFINIPFLYDNKNYIMKAKAIANYNKGLAYRDRSMLFKEDSVEHKNLLLKAVKAYESCLTLDPDSYDARYNLAVTNHLLGYYTDALINYCKALMISPVNYDAHYNLAILLRQKRNYKDALDELKQAGTLIDYTGDASTAAFIYGMLNETSQLAIAEYGIEPGEFLAELKNQPYSMGYLTKEEMEKVLIKKIKTNSVCKKYLQ